MADPSLPSPNDEAKLATQTPAKSLPKPSSQHALPKTLASASNFANLLPTGTVLSFQALIPSFSDNGSCRLYNKYLASSLIGLSAVVCYLSSFADSFRGKDGKLHYGIATFGGFYIFDYRHCEGDVKNDTEMKKLRISFVDVVHAFVSLIVFLIFAFSNRMCGLVSFPKQEPREKN
ncbi:protein DMP3 [Rhodamnia argentea]|uniref:Protein DMP3 n=1 Tax=Rhodamnia argentea TaxID=178133 RepID=A0A8B8QH25_9MYRT|nr:protein DMP3 [Rhodamnia argentea]